LPANTANNLIIPGAGLLSLGAPTLSNTVPGPFDFTSIDGMGNLTIFPGTVNNLLISNPFSTVSCSAQNLSYITVSCQCSQNQVNLASYSVVGTPPAPPIATLGAPPQTFSVLIGLVNKSSSGKSYTLYKTFSQGNIIANPLPWIQTDKTSHKQINFLTINGILG